MPKLVVDNQPMNTETKNITDVFLITKEFKTSTEFSQYIERKARRGLAAQEGIGYIDVLCDYCLEREIEIESVKKLLSPSLKEKIKVEAENLNLLKTKPNKLPLD